MGGFITMQTGFFKTQRLIDDVAQLENAFSVLSIRVTDLQKTEKLTCHLGYYSERFVAL